MASALKTQMLCWY